MRMERRGIIIHPEDISPLWPQRLHQAGINVLGLHPAGGAGAPASLRAALNGRDHPDMRRFLRSLDRLGIAVEYEMHALGYLLPPELLEKHPEFFPMDGSGVRRSGLNMCATHPDALDYIAGQSYRLARQLPSQTHRYYFWLDDTATAGCHCPQCRSLSPSDQQLCILNAMLSGIRQADSKGMLAYLAYVSTLTPPLVTRPSEGIFLEYAPIQRDFHRPLSDGSCAKNSQECAPLPALLAFFGVRHAQVLEYWMDNSLYSGWKRPPQPFTLDQAVMAKDLAYYAKLGFSSVTSFGCFLGPDYEALYGEPPLGEYGRLLSQHLL